MPKIDFLNQKIPKGYKLPEPNIILVEGMECHEVIAWINQELYYI